MGDGEGRPKLRRQMGRTVRGQEPGGQCMVVCVSMCVSDTLRSFSNITYM